MIACCDFISSIVLGFGYPYGAACLVQGYLVFFFLRAAWMWTLCLSYSLFSLIIHEKQFLKTNHQHMIIWPLSIVLELLPLSTNSYGNDIYDQGFSICNISYGDNKIMAELWIVIIFFIPLLIICISMFYFSYRVWYKYHYHHAKLDPVISSAVECLSLYPIGMLITSLPVVICTFFFFFNNNTHIKGLLFSNHLSYSWGRCAIYFKLTKLQKYKCI